MESSVEDLTKKLEETTIDNSERESNADKKFLEIAKELSLEEIKNLIDKLYIEMLDLTEQYIRNKVELEKRQNEGNLLIAKARYIHGGKTVSVAQLPTVDSLEFNALVSVSEETSKETLQKTKLIATNHPIDKNKGYLDPIKWFGVLVPRSLHFAKERYILAVDLAIESANIQRELAAVINYIEQLQKMRIFKSE